MIPFRTSPRGDELYVSPPDPTTPDAHEALSAARELRVREEHSAGHEPLWLAKAKGVYRDLGACLSLLSHHEGLEGRELADDLRAYCEATLRRMVKSVGRQDVDSIELFAFLDLVDDAARRKGGMRDAREPIESTLAVATGILLRREVGFRLLEPDGQGLLRDLLEAWPHEKPRGPGRPSKWELAVRAWKLGSGRSELPAPKSVAVSWQQRKQKKRSAAVSRVQTDR